MDMLPHLIDVAGWKQMAKENGIDLGAPLFWLILLTSVVLTAVTMWVTSSKINRRHTGLGPTGPEFDTAEQEIAHLRKQVAKLSADLDECREMYCRLMDDLPERRQSRAETRLRVVLLALALAGAVGAAKLYFGW